MKRDEIRKYLAEHPGVSVRAAARDLGVSYSTVSRVRATHATPDDATPATLPEGWVSVSIRADVLDRLVPEPAPARKPATKRTVAVRGLQPPADTDADRLMRGESVPGGPGACSACGHLTLWHTVPRYRRYEGQPCQAEGCDCQAWTRA
jgi:hypothetical protein